MDITNFLSNLKLKKLQQGRMKLALEDFEDTLEEISQLKESMEFELGAISDLRQKLESILYSDE